MSRLRKVKMYRVWWRRCQSSSSSASLASHVARRSTGVSNSGFRSTNSRRRSAIQARDTSSSPRRAASSSIPRSVKYMRLPALRPVPPHAEAYGGTERTKRSVVAEDGGDQALLLGRVHLGRTHRGGRAGLAGHPLQLTALEVRGQFER